MKTYKVKVVETLRRIVEVEAESMSDAIDKVQRDYDDGKIVLSAEDSPSGSEEIMGVDE